MSLNAGNWVELQRKLAWLADGVMVNTISLNEYIDGVRELLDSYEFISVNSHV